MARITLSEKLIISFMLLSMGAIGIVGVYSYISASKAQMARTYDQLASVRYLKRKEVESFYHERLREVQSMASNPILAGILGNDDAMTGNKKVLSLGLSAIMPSENFYNQLFFLNNGSVKIYRPGSPQIALIADSIQQRQMDSLFRLAIKSATPYISDLARDIRTGEWVQFIVAKAPFLENHDSCFLAFELRSAAIDGLMADRSPLNGLGISGESYLAGKDQMLRSSSRFLENSIFTVKIDTSTARLAFSGSNGTYLMNDYRGIPVLGSFSTLRPPCPNWAVIAEIDQHEAMIPIYSIRNNVIFITAFIAVIVFFATWWLSKKISKPVIRLQKAARDLGEGKLGTVVEVTTQDEIGELAQSFNRMSEQLKEKDKELQKERAGRMRAAFDGQDMERQRLSRELHDGLGQSLIAQKLRLESLEPKELSKAIDSINELKTCSDQLVDEVRRISNALMPAQLNQFGLIAALRQQCEEISKYSTIDVTFDPTGNFKNISRKTKTYVFRIVQEALNNAVKHSGASVATVEIAETRENIFLSISDNGIGFNPEKACQGNGMNNMQERTNLLQGKFSINSHPGEGTTIEIQIPIHESNR